MMVSVILQYWSLRYLHSVSTSNPRFIWAHAISKQYSIKVSLYTTEEYDETGFSDYLTGESGDNNFYTSSRVVAKGGVEGGSTDGQWKEFTITLDYGDAEFDINQKYRFAIVCSSSKEGDKFWGAPESKLWVDDIEVIYKK